MYPEKYAVELWEINKHYGKLAHSLGVTSKDNVSVFSSVRYRMQKLELCVRDVYNGGRNVAEHEYLDLE